MAQTKIEWTATVLPDGSTVPGFTFNSWLGCTKISAACDACYAEAWSKRSGLVKWGNHPRRRTSENYWRQPIKWNREAERDGVRRKVFCCSLADVFDNQVPDEWRTDLWHLIHETPHLDWLLLTKRPQNIAKMLPAWQIYPWPNVWLGATAEDQAAFDLRWPYLADVAGVVKFISYEPALGSLSVAAGPYLPDWVIFGGESGPRKRPADLQWGRNLRDECATLGVKFFGKQDDGVRELPPDLMVRQFPEPHA